MTAVRAGQLARRLRIQARASTQDSFGGQQLTWTDLITVWVDIQPLSGRELESAQRMASEISHQIIVRYQPLFADTKTVAGYRALYKGRIFNIHASMNEDEKNAVITLLASEGLNDG